MSRLQLDTPARIFYAVGGIATGIIHNGLTSFVLLYYNLVLGVPAAKVGLVLGLTLVFDAVLDPLIGHWSDNLHSRWGRRHPLMYVSIVPVTLLFLLLWNPPAALIGSSWLFAYLLVVTVALRVLLACYEVSSNALVPELTESYDERTRLLNYRVSTYFFSAQVITVLLYGVWLRNTPEHPNGLLNASGYEAMGLYGGIAVLLAMLASSAGLHRFIPLLRSPPAKRPWSLRRLSADWRGTFSDGSLIALLAAGVFYASANGTINALWAYLYGYFWGLGTGEFSQLIVIFTLSAPAALLVLKRLSRGRDKRSVGIGVLVAGLLFTSTPVLLRLLGLFPGNDSAWLFPLLACFGFVEMTIYTMCTVMFAAMLADLVEKRQLATGMRQEGLLFSLQMFMMKVSSGVGLWIAGLALDLIGFPISAEDPADVPADTLFQLGLVYSPCMMVLYALAVCSLIFYRVTRATHQEHLSQLGARSDVKRI